MGPWKHLGSPYTTQAGSTPTHMLTAIHAAGSIRQLCQGLTEGRPVAFPALRLAASLPSLLSLKKNKNKTELRAVWQHRCATVTLSKHPTTQKPHSGLSGPQHHHSPQLPTDSTRATRPYRQGCVPFLITKQPPQTPQKGNFAHTKPHPTAPRGSPTTSRRHP